MSAKGGERTVTVRPEADWRRVTRPGRSLRSMMRPETIICRLVLRELVRSDWSLIRPSESVRSPPEAIRPSIPKAAQEPVRD